MMSARTTFRSTMTLRSMILAWTSLLSSSVLCPLSNPSLGTDCRHDAAKEPTRILPKTNNPKKNILVR
jgi:hypothetical protein